jgi:hypothetical protein
MKLFHTIKMEGQNWGVYAVSLNNRKLVSNGFDREQEAENIANELNQIAGDAASVVPEDSIPVLDLNLKRRIRL